MNGDAFGVAIANLQRAAGLHSQLHNHFERFCANALEFNQPASLLKGIVVERKGPALEAGFLGRRIRVSLRLDRKARKERCMSKTFRSLKKGGFR